MLRNLTTLFIILTVSFAAGLWVGQNPNRYPEHFNFKSTQIKILISDAQYLPTDWKTWEAKVRVKIDLIETKNFDKFNDLTESVDIIFAPQEWLRMSNAKGSSLARAKGLHRIIESNISTDFLTEQAVRQNWIPYWWTVQDDNLLIYSWVLRSTSKARFKKSIDLLEFILDKDIVVDWLDDVPYKTTFMSLDESSIPEEKKSSQIRKIKFPIKN